MRPIFAIALTLTAAITLGVFVYNGQPGPGFLYSSVPGVIGLAFVPHKEQRAPQAPPSPSRSTKATQSQIGIQEKT